MLIFNWIQGYTLYTPIPIFRNGSESPVARVSSWAEMMFQDLNTSCKLDNSSSFWRKSQESLWKGIKSEQLSGFQPHQSVCFSCPQIIDLWTKTQWGKIISSRHYLWYYICFVECFLGRRLTFVYCVVSFSVSTETLLFSCRVKKYLIWQLELPGSSCLIYFSSYSTYSKSLNVYFLTGSVFLILWTVLIHFSCLFETWLLF